MKYDLCMEITVNKKCNFNCEYCFDNKLKFKIKNRLKRVAGMNFLSDMDIYKFVRKIEKLDKKCLVSITGGEPFLFPQFIKLCQLLTIKNHIDITTNLSSKKIYQFADTINPKKVEIMYISFHPEKLGQLNLIDDFISKVQYLKKKGFKTRVSYVMYPPLLKRFEKDYEFLKSWDIKIEPKKYRGKFNGKNYPSAYTKNEMKLLRKYMTKERKKLLDMNFNLKGRKCLTGKNSIVINQEGQIFRCWGDQKPMGNFIKGEINLNSAAKPCQVDECKCPTEAARWVQK